MWVKFSAGITPLASVEFYQQGIWPYVFLSGLALVTTLSLVFKTFILHIASSMLVTSFALYLAENSTS